MLDVPEKQGATTLRKQLEHIHLMHGIRDARLDSVHVPEGFEYLWAVFWEIRGGAGEGMSGQKITWRDLAGYSAITGCYLDAFEVQAVMAMDAEVSSYLRERTDG